MKIYNSIGVEIADVVVSDESYSYDEIKSSHTLTLYFDSPVKIDIPVKSYVVFENETYTLEKPHNYKRDGERALGYTLVLDAPIGRLSMFKVRNLVDKRLKFSLTAKPSEHLALIVGNMNAFGRDSGWTSGDCVEQEEITLEYSGTTCLEALENLANKCETEYEVTDKQISVKKVEYNKDNPLILSYGAGKGFVPGLERKCETVAVEVLHVEGGERNIDQSKYGSSTLLLPTSQILEYEGRSYISSPDGLSIKRSDKALTTFFEQSIDCSDVYPSRVGTVSAVETEAGDDYDLYDIIDSSIPDALDYSACRIEGQEAKIIFQSGMLAGKEFAIMQSEDALTGYTHAERRFKLVSEKIDGQYMPNATFTPVIGDKYIIVGVQLPDAYICDNPTKTGASWDMFRKAAKYLYENEDDHFDFSGEIDGILLKKNWDTIGGKIKLGGYILFQDTDFHPEGLLIRIKSIKKYVNKPKKPIVGLSNSVSGSSVKSDINNIDNKDIIIKKKYDDSIRFTRRRFVDALETMKMLESALLNFTGSINPIAIQTMQILLGDKSLQFRFVDDSTTPAEVEHAFSMNDTTDVFSTGSGVIQHMTLGISSISSSHAVSEYKFWNISAYESAVLEANSSYYLYIKASKSTTSATFLLSKTAIAIESVTGYYHFLTGILNKRVDGERSFVTLYGFSEILPGRITTSLIISPDGECYINLATNTVGGKMVFKAGSSGLANLVEYAGLVDSITDAQDDATAALSLANSLDSYIDGAFHDGVIDESEAIAIGNYLATIDDNWTEITASYAKIYANPSLSGIAKSNLYTAYTTLDGVKDELVAAIVAAIADSKITGTESSDVNILIEDYRTALTNYTNAVQDANTAILSTYEYLKEAIESGETMIAGGLVLTNALLLKNLAGAMTAGISGLTSPSGKAVPWLFADAEKGDYDSVLQKAQLKKARFYMLTDGTAGLGLMKVEKDRVAICKQLKDSLGRFAGLGQEIVVFQDSNIPTLNELVTTLTKTDVTYSGSISMSESAVGNLAYSSPMTVTLAADGFSSFTIRVQASLHIVIANDEVLGEKEDAEIRLNLYSVSGSTYTLVRQLGILTLTNDTFETRTADLAIDESFTIPEGSYVIRGEYVIDCQTVVDTVTVSVTDGIISASAASAKQQTIIGLNGLVRIKDANNFDYLTDTDAVFSRGEGKSVVLSGTDTNFMTVFGKTDMQGLLGSGSVSSAGTLANAVGKATNASKSSTGMYTVIHGVGHANYSVALTLNNPASNLTIYITAKYDTYFTVKIINPHTDTLTNGSFDFQMFGNNV
jgi:hypothetical protein